jgi:hypothetical protein
MGSSVSLGQMSVLDLKKMKAFGQSVCHLFFMGGPWPIFHGGLGVCGPYYMRLSRGPWHIFHEGFKRVRGRYFKGIRHPFFMGVQGSMTRI